MSKKQYDKTTLVLKISDGHQARELDVPTSKGADDEEFYREINKFVNKNTKYDSILQLLNMGRLQELNLEIENEGGITHRGMNVTQIKYPR